MEASQQPQQPFTDEAKQLLEGIINTEHQSGFSLLTSHAGTLMVTALVSGEDRITSYDNAKDYLSKFVGEDDLNKFIEVETFIWAGGLGTDMWIHRKFIRVGWVIEVIEVTDEQWKAYVTDHVAREQQAAINRAQQSGLMG